MDFLILNFYLYIVCIPVLLTLRLSQKWLMLSLASFFILALPEREREDRSALAAVARIASCAGAFLYIAVAWSAFCVAITTNFSGRQTATWYWLYIAASLVWFIQLPLRELNPPRLYRKVSTGTRTVWEQTTYTFQFTLILSFAIWGLAALAWIVFTIRPGLTLMPYGWILKPSLRSLEVVDSLLKQHWWLPSTILAIVTVRMFVVRARKDPTEWQSWGDELDRVVFMSKNLSRDWAWYSKTEFLNAILSSWGGATAEDCGSYVLVRNESFSYFEFRFMFGEPPNARLTFLFVRGLKELQGLWILGRSGELVLNVKPTASHEAQKAAGLLQKKFDLGFADQTLDSSDSSSRVFSIESFKQWKFDWAMTMATSVDDQDDRINWCNRAFQIVETMDPWRFPKPKAFSVGSLHAIRGQVYLDLRARDFASFSRLAVADLEAATKLLTPADGTYWSQAMNLLSLAYCERVDGNPLENIKLAITTGEAALSAIDPLRDRGVWIEVAHNLAGCYESQLSGVPRENRQKALSILLQTHAMVSFEFDPLEWARVTASLGHAYHKCNENNGDDNETAIKLIESALPVLLAEAPAEQWAGTMINLAACYSARIKGDLIANINQAIQIIEQALDKVNREESPEVWGMLHMNLGGLWARREDGDKPRNLDLAIRAFENALAAYPAEVFPVQHAEIMLNMSQVRGNLKVGPRKEHTEVAVADARKALASVSRQTAPQVWALAQVHLGNCLRERVDGNRHQNLDDAIVAFETALSAIDKTSDAELWSMAKSSLANALAERVTDNPVESLERSILHQQEALEVLNPITAPEEWASALRSLSISFGERVIGSRADNTERAIALAELAMVVLNRHDHPTLRSELLETIGEGFEYRVRGNKLANLYRALEAYDAAWETRNRSENPEAWLRLRQRRLKTRTLLHHTYTNTPPEAVPEVLYTRLSRWASTIEHADPQEFLATERDAASAVSAEDYPRTWTIAQESLAKAQMVAAATEGGELEEFLAAYIASIHESIKTYEAMLAENPRKIRPRLWARTRGHMATAYELLHLFEDLRHRGPGGLADRARVDLPNRSEAAMRYLGLAAEALQDMLLVHTAEADPIEYLKNAVRLGSCHVGRRDWEAAASVFASAAVAADRLLARVESCESEVRDTLRALGDLSTAGPFVEIINGRLMQSVELLEVGRARLLAKTLKLTSLPLSDDKREELNKLLKDISIQERLLAGPNLIDRTTPLDEAIRLREKFREILADVDPTVLSPKIDAKKLLREVLSEGIVIVVPIFTEVGGRILLGYSSGTEVKLEVADTDSVVSLEYGIFKGILKEGLPGWFGAYEDLDESIVPDWDRWNQVLHATAERLSELVADPILPKINAFGINCTRLDILPLGPLGLLPLNLARDRDTGTALIDRFEINLSPSLTALAHVRSRSRATRPRTMAFIRHTDGVDGNGFRNDLEYTPAETDLVTSWFEGPSVVKDGRDTSKEVVLDSLRGKDIWHFACHGYFDLDLPLRSRLGPFKQESLTLEELFDARGLGNPQLVVLSACSTGLYDTRELPSEFIGLPNAFLQLGATAVIATLWPVDDVMTTLLIGRFYEEYIGNGKPSCSALRAAQLWLRDLQVDELQLVVEKWVSEKRLTSENLMKVQQAIKDWTTSARTAYWAGFVHFGA